MENNIKIDLQEVVKTWTG